MFFNIFYMAPKRDLGKCMFLLLDNQLDEDEAISDDAWWEEISYQIQAIEERQNKHI